MNRSKGRPTRRAAMVRKHRPRPLAHAERKRVTMANSIDDAGSEGQGRNRPGPDIYPERQRHEGYDLIRRLPWPVLHILAEEMRIWAPGGPVSLSPAAECQALLERINLGDYLALIRVLKHQLRTRYKGAHAMMDSIGRTDGEGKGRKHPRPAPRARPASSSSGCR